MNFSVLVSIYCKENPVYFQESLKSIINQSIKPSEIVLVKDGKLTNELDEIIESYTQQYKNIFKIVSLEKNVGLGKALNIGLNNCSYELVARMDTDDICKVDRFEKQLSIFKSSPEVGVVGTWVSEFQSNEDINNPKVIKKVPLTHNEIKKYAKFRNPINHMSVMFKKSEVLTAGNYQHLLWNEDYYLWIRMLKNKSKIVNIPDITVNVRAGKEMYSRRGGYKYIVAEYELQRKILKMEFINIFEFFANMTIRSITRILPNNIRGIFYKKVLRR
jgi:glycosyltransferase involved in cell wall biosynthesis